MSTSATIQVGETTFYQSHDGGTGDVIDEMQEMIKEAKEKAKRNVDYTWMQVLKHIMMAADYVHSEMDDFSPSYSYEVNEDGSIVVIDK